MHPKNKTITDTSRIICWEIELEKQLNLTPYQLEFYGRHKIPRNENGARVRSRLFEKYKLGSHMPSTKTLRRFKGTKGEKAEYWLDHDTWLHIDEREPSEEQLLRTLNKVTRSDSKYKFNKHMLESDVINLMPISKCGAIEHLWRKGSMEALSALFALMHIGLKHKKTNLYLGASFAAYQLTILRLSETPLYFVRNELFEYLKETKFKDMVLYEEVKHSPPQIELLHNNLNETFLALNSLGVPLATMQQKSTALYRLWRSGVCKNGFFRFHQYKKYIQRLVYDNYFSKKGTQDWHTRNFGLGQFEPYTSTY